MLCQSRPDRVKQRFWRFFVHISTSRAKLKKSVSLTTYFALGYAEAVYQVSARLTMKMLGAKAFWVVFRIFFFYLKEFLKKNQITG